MRGNDSVNDKYHVTSCVRRSITDCSSLGFVWKLLLYDEFSQHSEGQEQFILIKKKVGGPAAGIQGCCGQGESLLFEAVQMNELARGRRLHFIFLLTSIEPTLSQVSQQVRTNHWLANGVHMVKRIPTIAGWAILISCFAVPRRFAPCLLGVAPRWHCVVSHRVAASVHLFRWDFLLLMLRHVLAFAAN